MTVSQMILILKGRLMWIVLPICACIALAFLANALIKPKYTASAVVLIDARNPDPVNGTPSNNEGVANVMSTQLDLIASERVARKVVRALGLVADPQQKSLWQAKTGGRGDPEVYFAQMLLQSLDIRPSHDSNVVTIAYTTENAALAARVANLFAESYVEAILELKVEPAYQIARWFDGQTLEARQNLEKAQARLTAYRTSKGMVASTSGQADLETARLNELSSQLATVQGARIDSNSRKTQAANNALNSPDVFNNRVVEDMRAELAKAESSLGQLSKQIGSNHPNYLQAQENIKALRSRLDEEVASVARTVNSTNTVNESREQALRAAVITQKQKVLDLSKSDADVGVLVQDVENAQRSLDSVMLRRSQTALQSQAQQTNVLIVARASEPPYPSRPKPLLNIVLGILFGACMGTALAFAMEWRTPLVRSARDITDITTLPIILELDSYVHKGSAPRSGISNHRQEFTHA